jgi:type IV secretion system protein VirB5
MKIYMLPTLLVCSCISINVNASNASSIISLLEKTYGIDVDQLSDLDDMNKIESELKKLDKNQLTQLEGLLSATTGNFQYGSWQNDQNALTEKQWSPNTWQSALANDGENNGRYEAYVSDYQSDHPSLDDKTLEGGMSEDYVKNYHDMVSSNQAVFVQTNYEFEDLNTHLETIQELSEKIEDADTQKAIADLNARINTEIAYLTVEEIKMLTMVNEQLAQQQASEILNQNIVTKFNQIPKGEENET